MFVERKINHATGSVELWQCEWDVQSGRPTRKVFVRLLGEEQPIRPQQPAIEESTAICWSYGRTLGNIAVFSPAVLGSFPEKKGQNAILPCDFVDAGKFRHGASRWWCRTHQSHWGTKADYEAYERLGVMICANHEQPMNYVVNPFRLKVDDYAEVGIWCSMVAAASTEEVKSRPPRIHVHVRPDRGGKKIVDNDFEAIAIEYGQTLGLFENPDINQVNITPPAAYQFVKSLEIEQETTCISCSRCGYPHLDLGSFGERPHRKHFCGNCGRDSTWSSGPIISTPLRPLHDQFTKNKGYELVKRELDLDRLDGCNYRLWASTPAIVWTADRPQEKGIHVHVHDGSKRIVDETFGKVILGGRELIREELLTIMVERTVI